MRNKMVTRPMTLRDPKRSSRDSNTLRVKLAKTAGDAIYQQSLITAVRQYGRLS